MYIYIAIEDLCILLPIDYLNKSPKFLLMCFWIENILSMYKHPGAFELLANRWQNVIKTK